MADWEELSNGRISLDDAQPLLREASEDFERLAKEDPRVLPSVAALVAHRLEHDPTMTTWSTLEAGLTKLIGPGPASLFGWVTVGDLFDDGGPLEAVLNVSHPPVSYLLREIFGMYGPELGAAYALARQPSDDWKMYHREVYIDRITNYPVIQIRLTKYSGDEVVVEGSASSLLTLTDNLVLTLQLVADPAFYTQESIDSFREDVTRLLNYFAPTSSEQEVEGANESKAKLG